MAGDWIPLYTTLPRKAEVLRIARETSRSRYEVVGLLVDFWCWAQAETCVELHVDADVDAPAPLNGVTLIDLVGSIGADDAFWRSVCNAGWLEETEHGLRIPGAGKWLSKGAKARMQKAIRQQKWRKKCRKGTPQHVDAHVDAHVGARAPLPFLFSYSLISCLQNEDKEGGKEDKEGKKDLIVVPKQLDDPRFEKALREWEEHRVAKKKPLTARAARMQLKRLSGMELDRAIAAIEYSIERDWEGVFEPDNREGLKGQGRLFDPRGNAASLEEAKRQLLKGNGNDKAA